MYKKWVIENPVHIELAGERTCPGPGKSAVRTNRIMEALAENFYKKEQ